MSVFILVIQLLLVILGKIFENMFFTHLAVLNLIFFLIYNYIYNMRNVIIFWNFIFVVLLNIIGVYIIETQNIYLYEIDKSSYFKNSLIELILIQMIFLYVLLKKEKKFFVKKININRKIKFFNKLLVILIFIYVFYFFIIGVKDPYFTLNMDRFLYKNLRFSLIERKLFDYNICIFYLQIFLLYVFKNEKIYRILLKVSIILMIITGILVGNKFGEFIAYLNAFTLVNLRYNRFKIEKIKKIISIIWKYVVLIIVILFIHKSLLYTDYDFKDFRVYFYNRGAQQGQLWWGTYDKKNKGTLSEVGRELLSDEQKYRKTGDFKTENGIWKIMLLNTPKNIIENRAKSFSSYTMSSNASINYYFGLIGNILFSIIMGICIRKSIYFFFNTLNDDVYKIFVMFIFFKLQIMVGQVAFMSNFGMILSIKFMIYILISIIILQKYKN